MDISAAHAYHDMNQYDKVETCINPQNANPVVQETIRVAMQRLSKGDRANVTKLHILKTLFLAKNRLPDGSSIKRDLAYYWYMMGPYSEVVDANLTKMVESGMVEPRITSKLETYRLAPDRELRPVTTSADLDAAKSEIGLVVKEFSNTSNAITETYETAPFKWYTTYRLEFKPKTEHHFKHILDGRESQYSEQDVLELLDDAVLDYPTDRAFRGHRAAFMDYAKMLNTFLRWDSYRTRKDMAKVLLGLCNTIWVVFAYGVRIYHHDSYYDNQVGAWETIYKQQLTNLDHTVRRQMVKFDEAVKDDVYIDHDTMDTIQHPEKYKFESWVSSATTRDG